MAQAERSGPPPRVRLTGEFTKKAKASEGGGAAELPTVRADRRRPASERGGSRQEWGKVGEVIGHA